jgi:hypothetical protein
LEFLQSLCAYAPLVVFGLGVAWLMYVNSLRRALAVLKAFGGATSGLRYDSLTETVVGEIDGVAVRISIEPLRVGSRGSERRATQFRLRDPRASKLSLQRYREAVGAVRTGDPGFDGEVVLLGPRGDALAAMGPQDRRRVAHAVARGWVCTEGVWTYEVPRRIVRRSELTSLLAYGLDVSRALHRDGPTGEALAERVMGDDLVEVRQEALAALLAEGPLAPHLEARLLAEDGPVAVPVAARLPAPRDVEQLVAFVDHEDPETSWLATQELLRRDVEVAVVRRGLVRGLDGAWCGAAIEELGRRGEVADVPALRALTERWLTSYGEAAEGAIRAIQSRARGAGVGQLALADGRGDGALSVVEEVDAARGAARRGADRRTEG